MIVSEEELRVHNSSKIYGRPYMDGNNLKEKYVN